MIHACRINKDMITRNLFFYLQFWSAASVDLVSQFRKAKNNIGVNQPHVLNSSIVRLFRFLKQGSFGPNKNLVLKYERILEKGRIGFKRQISLKNRQFEVARNSIERGG